MHQMGFACIPHLFFRFLPSEDSVFSFSGTVPGRGKRNIHGWNSAHTILQKSAMDLNRDNNIYKKYSIWLQSGPECFYIPLTQSWTAEFCGLVFFLRKAKWGITYQHWWQWSPPAIWHIWRHESCTVSLLLFLLFPFALHLTLCSLRDPLRYKALWGF